MTEPQAAAAAAATEESPTKPQVDTANVEMSDLQSQSAYTTPAEERPQSTIIPTAAPAESSQPAVPAPTAPVEPVPTASSTTATPQPSSQPLSHTAASSVANVEPIGPSTTATTTGSDAPPAGASIKITLLIPMTGARHPYEITPKYLRKRSVEVEGNDPANLSVYTLKELIWREWRNGDWEARPSSPAYIRLINMGRMLDDKSALKDYNFKHDSNVVHMTVKPQEIFDDDDNAKGGKGGRERDGEEATAGCRCVIL